MAFKRILLRRDTASNWTSGNAVLAAGEIGYETNTGKFKIGNGATAWTSLGYSITSNISAAVLNDLGDVTITSAANGDFLRWNGTAWINDAVDLATDTIGSFVQSLVAGSGITLTNNSGENATPTIAVTTNTFDAYGAASTAAGNAATALTNHENDTTNIHGIADTSVLVTTTGTQTLTNKTITSPAGLVKGDVGLGNADNTSDANKPVSTATQTALDLKSNLASPTFTGTVTAAALTVSGNLTVSGTTTSVNTETVTVDDNVIVLNNNATGAPTENAGIEIERGSSTNVVLRWNENDDAWELTNDGTTYSAIATASSVSTATTLSVDNLTDVIITAAADKDFLMYNGTAWVDQPITLGTDTTGNYVSGVSQGTGITVTHTPGEGSTATIAVDTTIATLASPALTGTPTAPTAAVGTSTTQIATTEFVMANAEDDQFILAGQIF